MGPRCFRFAESDLVEEFAAIAAVVGGEQGQELVERRAQRIDVGALIDDPAPGRRLLGAHVAQGPDHVAGHRQAAARLHPRQAEIGDPEVAPDVDQQIGRFDVAVDGPQAMGVIEGLGGLQAQVGDGAEIGGGAGAVVGGRGGGCPPPHPAFGRPFPDGARALIPNRPAFGERLPVGARGRGRVESARDDLFGQ